MPRSQSQDGAAARRRTNVPPPWIDISVPLHSGMVHWPGDPELRIQWAHRIERGDRTNLSGVAMGSHSGTHIDAPLHFLADGLPVDRMPPETTIGPARVVEIADAESVKPVELERYALKPGERILFKTRNSARPWHSGPFVEDYVHMSLEAAILLAERRLRVIGLDYLSVGPFHGGGAEVHRALLGAGVWIIEGLDLSSVSPGDYDLLCLPLRLEGCEGAPARAFVRPHRGRTTRLH